MAQACAALALTFSLYPGLLNLPTDSNAGATPQTLDGSCVLSIQTWTGTSECSQVTAMPRSQSYCQQVTNVASTPGDKAAAAGFLKAMGLLGLVAVRFPRSGFELWV